MKLGESFTVETECFNATGGYFPPNDNEKLRRLTDSGARQQIAASIRNACEKAAEVIMNIERALGK